MPNIHHLDHLVLTVNDINETITFYVHVLGMKKVEFGPGRIALIFGEQKINLHEVGKEIGPKADQPMPGSADLCFISKQNMNDWLDHLRKYNIKIIDGPVRRMGALGVLNSIYIRDPDGNLIEISNQITP
ncbi:MAG: VOC family virulence protein [Desulfobacca sp.]|nr:VOC family virulence protein [Desulfobacca sp.]